MVSVTVRQSVYDFIFIFHRNCVYLVPFSRYSKLFVESCIFSSLPVFGACIGVDPNGILSRSSASDKMESYSDYHACGVVCAMIQRLFDKTLVL